MADDSRRRAPPKVTSEIESRQQYSARLQLLDRPITREQYAKEKKIKEAEGAVHALQRAPEAIQSLAVVVGGQRLFCIQN